MYMDRYPGTPSEKLLVIPNGYDEEDFKDLTPQRVQGIAQMERDSASYMQASSILMSGTPDLSSGRCRG